MIEVEQVEGHLDLGDFLQGDEGGDELLRVEGFLHVRSNYKTVGCHTTLIIPIQCPKNPPL